MDGPSGQERPGVREQGGVSAKPDSSDSANPDKLGARPNSCFLYGSRRR